MGQHIGYYSSGISGSMGGPFTTYTSGAETYRVHTFLSSEIYNIILKCMYLFLYLDTSTLICLFWERLTHYNRLVYKSK